MAEPTETRSTTPATTGPSTAVSRSAASSTDDSRGTTKIADSVVTKVAGIAAREVAGVYALGGSSARAIGSVTQRVGIDARGQGVSVELSERQAAVDVTVVVEYGESIPETTRQIREQIIKRVEGLTGLEVTQVNIEVDDLHFAGDDDDGTGQA